MSSTFSQRAHSELEGTSRHMHAIVFHTHSVDTCLSGDEANAVGVVLSFHDVSLVDLSRRAGHLSGHVGYADLCRESRETSVNQ